MTTRFGGLTGVIRRFATMAPAMVSAVALAAAILLAAPGVLQAATTELLEDIGDDEIGVSSGPIWFGTIGSRTYFAATPFGGSR